MLREACFWGKKKDGNKGSKRSPKEREKRQKKETKKERKTRARLPRSDDSRSGCWHVVETRLDLSRPKCESRRIECWSRASSHQPPQASESQRTSERSERRNRSASLGSTRRARLSQEREREIICDRLKTPSFDLGTSRSTPGVGRKHSDGPTRAGRETTPAVRKSRGTEYIREERRDYSKSSRKREPTKGALCISKLEKTGPFDSLLRKKTRVVRITSMCSCRSGGSCSRCRP